MMKTIFLFAAVFVCVALNAQYPDQGAMSDTSHNYIIELRDKTSLSGKIIERTDSVIVFNEVTIGKVNIPVSEVVKITRLTGDQYCIVTTNDNKKFTGILMAQDSEELTVRTESLGDLTIPNSKIRDIRLIEKEQIKEGKFYFPNPHPTRYFFGQLYP